MGADHVLPFIASVFIPFLPKADQVAARLFPQRQLWVIPVCPAQLSVLCCPRPFLIDRRNHHFPGMVDSVMLIYEIVKCRLILPHISGLLLHHHIGSIGQVGG